MSEEPVEQLYRRGIDAFNRCDLDAFLALADPGVIGVSRVLAIEGGSYEGHQASGTGGKNCLGSFPTS